MSDPAVALGSIPAALRDDLMAEYRSLVRNYRESRLGPTEVDGGRLAEVAYTILHGHVTGTFAKRAAKPDDFVGACNQIAKLAPKGDFPASVRLLIPRMLIALYGIRSDCDASHVGVEVDSNHMDASTTLALARWVVAELVRLFHDCEPADASAVVEALTEREMPLVWEVADRRRVLGPKMTRKDQVLALLYATAGPVHERTLATWMEEPARGYFWRDVLRPMHIARLVEFDQETGLVHLSPLGVRRIEARLDA